MTKVARLVVVAVAVALARPGAAIGGTVDVKSTAPGASAPLTLQQAIDYAQAHNLSVQQAFSRAVAAAANLTKARSAVLPLVQGQLQNQMTRQTSAGNFAQFGLSPNPSFSQNTAALLGQLNVFNLGDSLTARQAKYSLDAALQDLRLARQQATFSVETGYYNYVQSAELVRVSQADVAYNKALLTIARANYSAGRVAGIDALKAQVQVASSSEKLMSAQADQEDARENLTLTIGADPQIQFALLDTIPAPAMATPAHGDFNALALANRPEIAVAQDDFNNAVIANAQVDAPNRPTVSLQGEWGNQDTTTTRPQVLAQCQIVGRPCPPTHFYAVGLQSTWTLPLLDWGSVHAAHGSAHAAIDTQRYVLGNARRQVLVDVDQAVRRLRVDREILTTAVANAQLAKQVAQISQAQYRVGVVGQIDAVASEQAYLQAARDLLAAQVAYVLGVEKLKLATGTL